MNLALGRVPSTRIVRFSWPSSGRRRDQTLIASLLDPNIGRLRADLELLRQLAPPHTLPVKLREFLRRRPIRLPRRIHGHRGTGSIPQFSRAKVLSLTRKLAQRNAVQDRLRHHATFLKGLDDEPLDSRLPRLGAQHDFVPHTSGRILNRYDIPIRVDATPQPGRAQAEDPVSILVGHGPKLSHLKFRRQVCMLVHVNSFPKGAELQLPPSLKESDGQTLAASTMASASERQRPAVSPDSEVAGNGAVDSVDAWAVLGLSRPGEGTVIDADAFVALQKQSVEQAFAEAWGFLMDEGRTVDDLRTACSRVGRNNEPALIWDLWCEDGWHDEIAEVVGDVWSVTEYPERALDQAMWMDIFNYAGFRRDGQITPPPTKSLTLYRGSTAEGRFGMSWTDDLAIAQSFARGGIRGRAAGTVWTADVEPRYLLAYVGGEGSRGESEYVVDPEGLIDVRELEGPDG